MDVKIVVSDEDIAIERSHVRCDIREQSQENVLRIFDEHRDGRFVIRLGTCFYRKGDKVKLRNALDSYPMDCQFSIKRYPMFSGRRMFYFEILPLRIELAKPCRELDLFFQFMGFLDKYGGSLVSAGGDLVSGVVNNLFANSAAKKQHVRQKELMELENDYAIDMFNRTNAYNTPSQQMKRLREAGLNPNLMYGNGSNAGGTADMPSAPSAGQASKADYPGIGNIGASAYHAYGESLQFKSIEANNARTHAETLAIKQNTLNAETEQLIKLEELWDKTRDNYIKDSTLPELINEKRLSVRKLQQDIRTSQAQEEDFWSRADVNYKQLDVFDSMLRSNKVMRNLNRAQFRKVMADARRAELENENFETFLNKIKSETRNNDSSTALNNRNAFKMLVATMADIPAALAGMRGERSVDSLWGFIDKEVNDNAISHILGAMQNKPYREAQSFLQDFLISEFAKHQ